MRMRGWCLRCLVLALCACQFHCIKVTFRSNRPLKVALSQTLVLEASVSEGTVMDDMWEIRREIGRNRVYPTGKKNPRISREHQGNKLKLTVKDIRKEDFGTYIVMVTDEMGNERSAEQIVEESDAPPAVSIRLLCEVSHDPNYDQWDVPKFEWLVDGIKEPNTSDKLSPDGRTLNILNTSGYSYTCRVSSSLGTRDNHYNTSCEQSLSESKIPDCYECTAERVIMSVALLGYLVLGFFYCKKRFCSRQSGASETAPTGSGTELQELTAPDNQSPAEGTGAPETASPGSQNERQELPAGAPLINPNSAE